MNPKTNFELLHDNVMIFPIGKQKKTESGILLTESLDATAPHEGFVIAAGPGKYQNGTFIPMQVKTGDRVFFMPQGGKEVKHAGDSFIVVPLSEVLCKVKVNAEA